MRHVLISVVKAEEPHKKEERPKSPSLLAKLLAPFKGGEKKVKEKVTKKVEKKEEVRGSNTHRYRCVLTSVPFTACPR